MSAIGDYVHYREQNYRIWGANRPREKYGNTAHYVVSSFHQYAYNKEMSSRAYSSANYNELEAETRKNATSKVMSDQQMLNLDYGQKIGQFRSMVIALAEGRTVKDYPKKLSDKQASELEGLLQRYNKLQRKVDLINQSFLDGKVTFPMEIKEITREYKALQLDGSRSSILGSIQQGFNDDAARIWKETLDGTLGQKIKECMSLSAKSVATSAVAESLSSLSGIEVHTQKENKYPYYFTSDSTGTTYAIEGTEKGWEFTSTHQRTNILKGSMKTMYKDQYHTFVLSGEINLGVVLEMLETQGRFGTHWLNKHASYLDTSMDEDLKIALKYEALTSGRNKYQGYGDFVYIDRNSGQIEHAEFWDVVRREEFSTTPDIAHKKFNNDWGGDIEPSYSGAFARISNLLQQVHAINITVASKPIAI